MLRPSTAKADPIAAIIAEIKVKARADGLTEAEIDAELAAYNAERRLDAISLVGAERSQS